MEENLSQENRFLVKESKLDKIMMVKFFIALLLTNSITYLIAFPPAESNKIIPEGFKHIALKIKNYTKLTEQGSEVILTDRDFNIISKRAVILEKINDESNKDETIFMVQISDKHLIDAISKEKDGLLAFPVTRTDLIKKIKKPKRKINYEIHL
ncbi:MAG: hypothetical protein H6622_14795 [Halobacteriovoraceae bacterium]|nr:hypothetical protein [Halobacteriovoraceae bacterium]